MKLPARLLSARGIAVGVAAVGIVSMLAGVGIHAITSSGSAEAAGKRTGALGSGPNGAAGSGSSSRDAGANANAGSSTANGKSGGKFVFPKAPRRPASFYANLPDVVNVQIPEDESWGGSDCNPPRQGSHCSLLFEGITILSHDTKGTIAFVVRENNAALPRTIDSMPANKYKTTVYRWVKYNVPLGVTDVVTEVELLNSKGVPLAIGHPQRYPIRA